MLRFMLNNKGMMSVFTLFLLIPVMIFSGLLIDFARALAVRAQAAAVAETYANSYLSMYDELLNEVYGLFAVTQSKEGTEALDKLQAYMKAAYAPGSMTETELSNSNALGLQDILKKVANGGQDYGQNYSKALSLTGKGFQSVDHLPQKPLVQTTDNVNNYDTLQMQISEYVKFIGPTDLLFTAGEGIAKMLKPDSEGNVDAEDSKNEVVNTQNNYKRLQKKQQIDNDLAVLNEQIQALYNAINEYDDSLMNYHHDVYNYSYNERTSYFNALYTVSETYEKLMDLYSDMEDAQNTEEGLNIYDFQQRANEILDENENNANIEGGYLDNIKNVNSCFMNSNYSDDFKTDKVEVGNVVNYDRYSSLLNNTFLSESGANAHSSYTSYSTVVEKRNALYTAASNLEMNLESIVARINELIEEVKSDANSSTATEDERKSAQKFAEGLEKDYAAIINMSKDGSTEAQRMYTVAHFNYNQILTDYSNSGIAKESENKIINDVRSAFFNEGKAYYMTQHDDYLESLSNDITDVLKEITSLFPDNEDIMSSLSALENTTWSIRDAGDEMKNFPVSGSLSDYYTMFSVNSDNKGNGISYQDLYFALRDWNFKPSNSADQSEFENITDELWKLMDEVKFDNTKLRSSLENKIMPAGNKTGDDANAGKTDLKNILDKDNSGLGKPDSGTVFINKLMLMLYDYGMFTCQTSDKKADSQNNTVTTQAPVSYQGITLAKGSDGSYETSETNFLLYGELEYIFNGNVDPQKNFNAVRNSLAIIRFVPNYISTYTISEINSLINTVQTSLSWCPLAAIVVAQALRVALASFETWCDLDLLYGGKNVLFYKNSLGDLSLIEKLKSTETGQKIFSKLNECSGGKLDSKDKGFSPSNLKINYRQYLIILQMIFVSQEDMIKRTADLIEANMSYMKNNCELVDKDGGKKSVDLSFKLSGANTAVRVECTVKNDFIFIGGVFNAAEAGYDEAEQLARDMEGKTYTYAVIREY